MELTLTSRLRRAWNAFTNNRDPTTAYQKQSSVGMGYVYRPDRVRFTRGNERTIMTSVFNQIALDVADVDIKHCRVDENGRYMEDVKSGLNECLTLEANIDQTGRAFIQDVVMSMFDEGAVAIVPVDTNVDPTESTSFDILSMRTGKILEWFPAHVKVRVYNDRTGKKEDIMLPKRSVAIVENPLYAIINEPNSTMQRLVRKLNILDAIDEKSGSGKLDLIIQLPYVVKTEARLAQAEKRRQDLEDQLRGPYGIAYTDGTEKITQLNRPIENNLLKQIEYLTQQLYNQIGMTASVFDGTADEKTMLNYNNRTIEPIVYAIVDAMKRRFLSKTARTQGQTIMAFRNPFKLVPVNELANIVDVFSRNEITSSNEWRQILGMKPSSDPRADQLRNSNMPQPDLVPGTTPTPDSEQLVDAQSVANPVSAEQVEESQGSEQQMSFWDIPLSAMSREQ